MVMRGVVIAMFEYSLSIEVDVEGILYVEISSVFYGDKLRGMNGICKVVEKG